MAVTTYMSGSLVRSSAQFNDITGALADPTTVTFKYQIGSGSVTDLSGSIVKESTGKYHCDVDTTGFTGPGTAVYVVEWKGVGAVQAINSDTWSVTPAPI